MIIKSFVNSNPGLGMYSLCKNEQSERQATGATTYSIMTISITTLSITTLGITTLSLMTLSITTLSITTLYIKCLYAELFMLNVIDAYCHK